MEGLRDDNKLQYYCFLKLQVSIQEIIPPWGAFIYYICQINKSRNISFENKAEILGEMA